MEPCNLLNGILSGDNQLPLVACSTVHLHNSSAIAKT